MEILVRCVSTEILNAERPEYVRRYPNDPFDSEGVFSARLSGKVFAFLGCLVKLRGCLKAKSSTPESQSEPEPMDVVTSSIGKPLLPPPQPLNVPTTGIRPHGLPLQTIAEESESMVSLPSMEQKMDQNDDMDECVHESTPGPTQPVASPTECDGWKRRPRSRPAVPPLQFPSNESTQYAAEQKEETPPEIQLPRLVEFPTLQSSNLLLQSPSTIEVDQAPAAFVLQDPAQLEFPPPPSIQEWAPIPEVAQPTSAPPSFPEPALAHPEFPHRSPAASQTQVSNADAFWAWAIAAAADIKLPPTPSEESALGSSCTGGAPQAPASPKWERSDGADGESSWASAVALLIDSEPSVRVKLSFSVESRRRREQLRLQEPPSLLVPRSPDMAAPVVSAQAAMQSGTPVRRGVKHRREESGDGTVPKRLSSGAPAPKRVRREPAPCGLLNIARLAVRLVKTVVYDDILEGSKVVSRTI